MTLLHQSQEQPEEAEPPSARTVRRNRARKGDGPKLRGEILDAAEALLVEKGVPDAVSMRAIARRIGVSPPAIYLHFVDKDELFFHCCNRRVGELLERLTLAAAEHDGVVDKLQAVGRAYVAYGLDHGELYKVMFLGPVPDSLDPDLVPMLPGPTALALATNLVVEGVARKELRPDLDPVATAVSLWSAVHGLVLVLLAQHRIPHKPDLEPSAALDQTIDVVTRGIRAG